ncbi:homocysteine S-methyltransferase [Cladorrhinum sp. PSN332]|nr:homocysteine S-methyltransferase [Cladorrhinum sp. PSN332]
MANKIPIRILDGGLGTTLETNYGYKFSSSTPLWSSHLLVTDQGTLLNCHQAFAEAGAEIISTATYQTSIEGFAATETSKRPSGVATLYIPSFLTSAIELASSAISSSSSSNNNNINRQHELSLTLGPLGATLLPHSAEYSGLYPSQYSSTAQIEEWHDRRLHLFAQIPSNILSKVSYLAFETIPRVDEIKAIRRVMKRNNEFLGLTGGKFWIAVNFPGECYTLPDGSGVEEVVNAMLRGDEEEAVPWGVGINCTKVNKLGRLVGQFEESVNSLVEAGEVREWPSLVLYPDGTKGEVYDVKTKRWEVPESEEGKDQVPWELQVAKVVQETRRKGQWREMLVGGCCRCLPGDIGRLREAIFGSKPEEKID